MLLGRKRKRTLPPGGNDQEYLAALARAARAPRCNARAIVNGEEVYCSLPALHGPEEHRGASETGKYRAIWL